MKWHFHKYAYRWFAKFEYQEHGHRVIHMCEKTCVVCRKTKISQFLAQSGAWHLTAAKTCVYCKHRAESWSVEIE